MARGRRNAKKDANAKRPVTKRARHLHDLLQQASNAHPLAAFPPTPAVYYKQRKKEINESEVRVKQLPSILSQLMKSGLFYLPNELMMICISYYHESIDMMISWTVGHLQSIDHNEYDNKLQELIPDSFKTPCQRSLNRLSKKMKALAEDYLWWFQMRSHVPLCISTDEIRRPSMMNGRSAVANGPDFVADMTFGEIAELPIYTFYNHFGFGPTFRAYEGRDISIAPPDLEHQYIVAAAITSERIEECAANMLFRQYGLELVSEEEIEALKTNRRRLIYNLFIAFAAIQVWIEDLSNFFRTSNPSEAQRICKVEWNAFNAIYQVGRMFVL